MEIFRCPWADKHPLLTDYHDHEWGMVMKDDDKLFEMLSLDCFQAGLSWLTILKKREAFLRAFDGFKIDSVAEFSSAYLEKLLLDPGIIRNRLKIPAIVNNARRVQEIRQEFGSFGNYVWSFTKFKSIVNRWHSLNEIPATSKISDKMSKDFKKRGFRFTGSTICYSFMQSIGVVNDHLVDCFRHDHLT